MAETGTQIPPRRTLTRRVPPTPPVPPAPPTNDEVAPKPAEFEPPTFASEPAIDDESVPSPAAFWARFKLVEKKMEIIWQERENKKLGPRPGLTRYACQAVVAPGVVCGKITESSPPGQPRSTPITCVDHGQSPHLPLE